MTEASNSLPTDGLLNEVNDEFSGLTLALSKGRILEETMPLLRAAGVELLEDPEASRKLIFPTSNPNVRVLILRASDVPTYVEHGAADFGVAGKDVLLEHGANHVYELLDLQIAQCKLMTAGVKGAPLPNRRLRIATKYVNVARYVRKALQSAGYEFTPNPSAYQYASRGTLAQAGFAKISNNTQPQVGDVVVYDRSSKHPHGHIQIFDGNDWVSDFRQSSISPYSGVYSYTTWRDSKYVDDASNRGIYLAMAD